MHKIIEKDGKKFMVITQDFQAEIVKEKGDGFIVCPPTLAYQKNIYRSLFKSKLFQRIDDFAVKEILEEQSQYSESDDEIIDTVVEVVNTILEQSYNEIKDAVDSYLDEYAKCFLWELLGLETNPILEDESGKLNCKLED